MAQFIAERSDGELWDPSSFQTSLNGMAEGILLLAGLTSDPLVRDYSGRTRCHCPIWSER